MNINWQGVYPAVTTQYFDDLSIDFAATQYQLN
ncbi:dihydrodipicolinate synthetase [Thalassotalea sp. ND16A]|nr:dihydrodipicolinate synthetase [Thalassotalea sp. ND16A]